MKLVKTDICTLAPFKEVDLSASLDGEIKLVALGNLGKKLIQIFLVYFKHQLSPPLSETTVGSTSSLVKFVRGVRGSSAVSPAWNSP